MSEKYDVIIVGAGISGALIANELSKAGKSVLILEAGPGIGIKKNGYKEFSKRYYKQSLRVPNSPYKHSINAPAPSVLDVLDFDWCPAPYYVYSGGKKKYNSNYTRVAGGTALHWLGTSLRMLPNDFQLKSNYGRGCDWPITYWDLKPYYEKAEWELGVSASRSEQESIHEGMFGEEYEYPMKPIPKSYLDQQLGKGIDGFEYSIGETIRKVKVITTPAARNGVPNTAKDPRKDDSKVSLYRAIGSPDNPDEVGQRCQGNSSCVPVCPIHAKYTPLKTIAAAQNTENGRVTILSQAIVTHLEIKSDSRITGVTYKRYLDPEKKWSEENGSIETVTASEYILAANAIENSKILLASKAANSSGLVGKNLMDHPYVLSWGTMNEDLGSYRGPGSTAGIPQFRDGEFRKDSAAFRVEIGNLGWLWPKVAPYTSLESLLNEGKYGAELRELMSVGKRRFRFGFGIEQIPNINNSVTISEDFKDDAGCYRPIINYDVCEYTKAGMYEARKFAKSLFTRMTNAVDETEYWKDDPKYFEYGEAKEPLTFEGAGHAGGTHKMGNSPKSSVVNSYQQSWDHENLFIVGSGSFCTMGTSNPTLTIAALAIRSSEKIIERLNKV